MNSYFYEYTARDRVRSWRAEADQTRRIRSLNAWKRTSRDPRRFRPNPRLNLPPTSLFDDLAGQLPDKQVDRATLGHLGPIYLATRFSSPEQYRASPRSCLEGVDTRVSRYPGGPPNTQSVR